MKVPESFLLFAILILVGAASSADKGASFPGIEALMTAEEYKAAGLQKLTATERAALNGFLIRYAAEDSQVLPHADEDVHKAADEEEVVSVIQQPFDGWSGKTVFKLKNGQVWQQRSSGNYVYMGSHPQVRIARNIMGLYFLELSENGKTVLVKRLQ